ncbi:MAG: hypothetical protein IJN72_09055 [Firmicutes bacterium]|nr:hypothetical protein [Bacillota bacterium]
MDMKDLGHLRTDYLEKEFGKMSTDEVVLTEERELHIKNRHPQDFDIFKQNAASTVCNPDIVIKDTDNPGTIFMIKKIEKTNLNIVVKLVLACEKSGHKNSVMTAYRLREKNLDKLIKKHNYNILYKKEY